MGKGVVANKIIQSGDFVCQYKGELISAQEGIDATKDDGFYGRLLNHAIRGNLKPRIVAKNETPQILFYATRRIEPGTQLFYNYGEKRKEVIERNPWLKSCMPTTKPKHIESAKVQQPLEVKCSPPFKKRGTELSIATNSESKIASDTKAATFPQVHQVVRNSHVELTSENETLLCTENKDLSRFSNIETSSNPSPLGKYRTYWISQPERSSKIEMERCESHSEIYDQTELPKLATLAHAISSLGNDIEIVKTGYEPNGSLVNLIDKISQSERSSKIEMERCESHSENYDQTELPKLATLAETPIAAALEECNSPKLVTDTDGSKIYVANAISSLGNDIGTMSQPRQTYFSSDWLTDAAFKDVIRADPNNKRVAVCLVCDGKSRVIQLSNMGKQALRSHCSGKKHLQRVQDRNSSLGIGIFAASTSTPVNSMGSGANPDSPSLTTSASEKDATATTVAASSQREADSSHRGLEKYILRDDVTKAEILWDLFSVESHLSLRTAGAAANLFSKMFPDSTIASKMELGRTKVGYNINHGLGPYFQGELVKDINNCDAFVAYFDESLNKCSQQQQMDVAIRFWSASTDEVSTRYLTSEFLGHTTADDLRKAFLSSLKPFNIHKLLQVSMDGPNVNLKFIRELETYLTSIKDPTDPMFLYMGSCGLHVVNNAFKTAFSNVTDWPIVSFIRSLYNLFKDVPSRRADLARESNSRLLPLKFCAVRWLQNKATATRAREMIPNLVSYIHYVESDKKRHIKSFSYYVVKKGVEDKLLPVKLTFFCVLAEEVEPFLKKFQSKEPMAPFLYSELNSVIVSLFSMIVKKDVMEKETSVFSVDLDDPKNLISAKDFKFSFSVKAELRQIKLTDKEMLKLKEDCMRIVTNMCTKLVNKSPLKYKLCKAITFCDPTLIGDYPIRAGGRLESALTIFQDKNWLSGSQCDSILKEFKSLCEKNAVRETFKMYDKSKTRVDHFWKKFVLSFNCSELFWKFIQKVLILSHGNADVERGFSINKEAIVENQLNQSLIAQRQVYGGVQEMGGVCNIMDIPKAMILKVRSSRAMYKEDLDRKKKNKEDTAECEINRKRLKDRVEELKKKKMKILMEKDRELESVQQELDNLL
ncbi:N-lysine methyltransferase KMT5A-A [Frankliniella fusca]|uniref:N-lysine methyltransferase KMT5A-A n=1 Tax=Frankliniella fusca TaxID=407009 RepID=A0AAE1LP64_9NEOP|nr:N-lysine methyltransferase KMT5A-A [Frankliniella fusca]